MGVLVFLPKCIAKFEDLCCMRISRASMMALDGYPVQRGEVDRKGCRFEHVVGVDVGIH
jgi:hypothetical protein